MADTSLGCNAAYVLRMKAWIDQDLCTGDGICVENAPDVFALLDDGLAYVKDRATIHDPGGPSGLATVPESAYETTIHSAEECAGECILIEVGQILDTRMAGV